MDMVSVRTRLLALGDVEEYEHFGKPAYRVRPERKGGKPGRTLLTLWIEEGHIVLMLDVEEQTALIELDPSAFRPHPSKWGQSGATIGQLDRLSSERFDVALRKAHDHARR
jgi:hypothetical protein